jgi:hypothetical protein
MSYQSHFALSDAVIGHLATVVAGTADPILQGQYAGFGAVSAVTVYELAIATIFADFAAKKHKVFGHFTASYFDRINGRIRLQNIRNDYVERFGAQYRKKFVARLAREERRTQKTSGVSMIQSYENIITWRNEFAHEGRAPTNATFQNVADAYDLGKRVLECLSASMTR